MSSLLDTAKYIVNTQAAAGKAVTPMKLQKLLFYVKAWGLVAGKKLAKGHFRKWEYGPVNTTVYSAFKSYGAQPIPQQPVEASHAPTGEEKEFIDFIVTCYGQFNAYSLSAMTHNEEPWQLTATNEIIKNDLIKAYYSKQPFAKNFPFDPENNPFYPLQSDLSAAFTMDMGDDEAASVTMYSSYNAYLKHLQQASGEFHELINRLLN